MVSDGHKETEPRESGAPSAFDKLAREIARRETLTGFRFLPGNAKLYMVEKGWKSFMINDDPRVVEVLSLSEFERAVCDREVHMIYVPATALITEDGIKRICQRHAATKAVIKEVEYND